MGPSDFGQSVITMDEISSRKSQNAGKRGVIGSIVFIIILTVLEFPKPIGFETRSQDNVSRLWLLLFAAIIFTEVAALVLLFKRTAVGAILAIAAGALNLFQVVADQMHMMQPESPRFSYSLIEYSVGLISIGLIYFAWKVLSPQTFE